MAVCLECPVCLAVGCLECLAVECLECLVAGCLEAAWGCQVEICQAVVQGCLGCPVLYISLVTVWAEAWVARWEILVAVWAAVCLPRIRIAWAAEAVWAEAKVCLLEWMSPVGQEVWVL